MNTFGERLANIRKARNLMSYELADKLHISKVRLSNYENNKSQMDQDTLVAVCKTLRVTSDYLLGLNPFPFDVQNQFTDEEVEFMLESVKVYRDTKEKYEQKRP